MFGKHRSFFLIYLFIYFFFIYLFFYRNSAKGKDTKIAEANKSVPKKYISASVS